MVSWHDPSIQLYSAHAATSIATISTGVALWEYVTCFGFDWEHWTRRRPFRWTLIPYLIARHVAMPAFGLYIYSTNAFTPVEHCRWVWLGIYVFAHLGLSAASLLLVIRAIALAAFNRWIMVVLGSLWLAEVGTQFHSLVLIKAAYIPQLFSCDPIDTVASRPYMLASFVLHFACLALVMSVLLRSPGAGLCQLLLSQGIVYFIVSMLGFTSSSVLLLLNLNDGMNLSLQTPTLVAVAICATRMYRGLVMYSTADSDAFTMTLSIPHRATERLHRGLSSGTPQPQHISMVMDAGVLIPVKTIPELPRASDEDISLRMV